MNINKVVLGTIVGTSILGALRSSGSSNIGLYKPKSLKGLINASKRKAQREETLEIDLTNISSDDRFQSKDDIPKELLKFPNLMKLKMNAHLAKELPEWFTQMPSLERLHITGGLLDFPEVVLRMPTLGFFYWSGVYLGDIKKNRSIDIIETNYPYANPNLSFLITIRGIKPDLPPFGPWLSRTRFAYGSDTALYNLEITKETVSGWLDIVDQLPSYERFQYIDRINDIASQKRITKSTLPSPVSGSYTYIVRSKDDIARRLLSKLEIKMSRNELIDLEAISKFKNLRELKIISKNQNTSNIRIPESWGNLKSLQSLSFIDIQELDISNLNVLKGSLIHFHLFGISKLVSEKEILSLSNLKHLDIGKVYNMTNIPRNIGALTKLEYVRFGEGFKGVIPMSIGNLKNLTSFHGSTQGWGHRSVTELKRPNDSVILEWVQRGFNINTANRIVENVPLGESTSIRRY